MISGPQPLLFQYFIKLPSWLTVIFWEQSGVTWADILAWNLTVFVTTLQRHYKCILINYSSISLQMCIYDLWLFFQKHLTLPLLLIFTVNRLVGSWSHTTYQWLMNEYFEPLNQLFVSFKLQQNPDNDKWLIISDSGLKIANRNTV